MKIALPSYQNQVDEHFGHCEYFTVFTIDDQKQNTVTGNDHTACRMRLQIEYCLRHWRRWA